MTTDEIVTERGKYYGHPRDNFGMAVGMFNALIKDYLIKPLPPEIVPKLQIILKLARSMHTYNPDNMADIAGYARTHEMLFEDEP